ncbi:hypothetical protein F5Y19DRAFT_478785 [Xylariaceae sp. FL1651]|nr:hypothetical protein F5Y19DRAFT_478785 [Xylariaceae sp. FL1651]
MMYTKWFDYHRARINKSGFFDSFSDRVVCFLKPLLVLGAEPNTKGFCLTRHPGHGSARGLSMFTSALGYFLSESFCEPPSCLKHTPELLSTFMATGPDLDDGIPLQLWINDNGIVCLVNDEYGLNKGSDYDRIVILYANLSYLIRLLCLRASQGSGTQSLAEYSNLEDRLSLTGQEVSPYPSIRVIAIFLRVRYADYGSYYRFNHEVTPSLLALLKLVEGWLGGSDAEDLGDDMREQVSLLAQEIEDGKEAFVKLSDPIEIYLAKEEYGYNMVEYLE